MTSRCLNCALLRRANFELQDNFELRSGYLPRRGKRVDGGREDAYKFVHIRNNVISSIIYMNYMKSPTNPAQEINPGPTTRSHDRVIGRAGDHDRESHVDQIRLWAKGTPNEAMDDLTATQASFIMAD